MQPVIVVDRVSKRYRRFGPGARSLREAFTSLHGRWRRQSGTAVDEALWALKDVSFDVARGTTLGIIGPNGAGKTTVLKLLTRITRPTLGRISVSGRVSALIELGAGFHPELTGRENVFLNGTILGLRKREVAARFDEIVAFAELQAFIDTPVKYYSSGMYARLAFAVAAHTNPELLLIDEVLAVGDYAFQQRCYGRMRELQRQGTTVVLISHDLEAIADTCAQVIVLQGGQLVFQGPTAEGIGEYMRQVRARPTERDSISIGRDGIAEQLVTHGARVVDVQLVDECGQPVTVAMPGDRIRLVAVVEFNEDAPHPHFACFVRDQHGQLVYNQSTHWQRVLTPTFAAEERVAVVYELDLNLVDGMYHFGLDVAYQDLRCYYDRCDSAASLLMRGGSGAVGTADLACRVSFGAAEQAQLALGQVTAWR